MSEAASERGQVRLEIDEAVARLHIDRLQKLNAFTATMSAQLVEHCAVIERDEAVRRRRPVEGERGRELPDLQAEGLVGRPPEVRVRQSLVGVVAAHLAQGRLAQRAATRAVADPIHGLEHQPRQLAALGLQLSRNEYRDRQFFMVLPGHPEPAA